MGPAGSPCARPPERGRRGERDGPPRPVPRATYARAVPEPSAPQQPSRPGDRLVQVGAAVFAVGLVAVVAVFAPALLADRVPSLPVVVTALSLLPLGFGLALAGLLRSARTPRREARRARRAARR